MNPNLTPTSSIVSPSDLSGPRRRLVSPYQETEEDESDPDDPSDNDDDDEPLGKILARRRGQGNVPMVRQGSEGYEVRPPRWSTVDQGGSMEEDIEWAYEEGSEGSDG